MRFARSLDHGATWVGMRGQGVGSATATDSFSPEINVAADGTIYIVWINGIHGTIIRMLVSTDGGDSFSLATPPATGVTGSDRSALSPRLA